MDTLSASLKSLKKNLESLQEEAKEIRNSVESWVSKAFRGFQSEINRKIELAFEENESEIKRDRYLLRFFAKIKGVFGVEKAKKKDAVLAVKELDQEIFKYIDTEVRNFKHGLETMAFDRQKELYEKLKTAMLPILQEFEKKLGEALKIPLKTQHLTLDFPSLDDFHIQNETLISKYLKTVEEKITEEYTTTEKRVKPGWTNDTVTYEDVKKEREVTVKKHFPSKEEIMKTWTEHIDEMTLASIGSVKKIIEMSVAKDVDMAQARIQERANEYRQIVEGEIRTAEHAYRVVS